MAKSDLLRRLDKEANAEVEVESDEENAISKKALNQERNNSPDGSRCPLLRIALLSANFDGEKLAAGMRFP